MVKTFQGAKRSQIEVEGENGRIHQKFKGAKWNEFLSTSLKTIANWTIVGWIRKCSVHFTASGCCFSIREK